MPRPVGEPSGLSPVSSSPYSDRGSIDNSPDGDPLAGLEDIYPLFAVPASFELAYPTENFEKCPSNIEPQNIFGDLSVYQFINNPSVIGIKEAKALAKYHLPSDHRYHPPAACDRIYLAQDFGGGMVAIGVTVCALECGLRFPLHPFYQKLFTDMEIAVGQLMPNSFIHINSFLDRCQSRGVTPTLRLFWTHHQFKSVHAVPGCYMINLRAGCQKWDILKTNTRDKNEEWVYVVGPNLAEFGAWNNISIKNWCPKLRKDEVAEYQKLIHPHDQSMVLKTAVTQSEKWLASIGVSQWADKAKEVAGRLNNHGQKMKNKESSSTGIVSNRSEQLLDSGNKPAGSPHGGKRKKFVTSSPPPLSGHTKSFSVIQSLDTFGDLATASSVQVGQDLSKTMLFPGDVSKYQQQSLPDRSAQVLAHLSQAFAWASLTDDGAKDSQSAILAVQQKCKEAESRATRLRDRLSKASGEAEKAQKSLAKAKRRVRRRDKTIVRESARANQAEETMYQLGRLEILNKAKDSGVVDYKLLLPDPQVDLLVDSPMPDPMPQSPEEASEKHSSCDEDDAEDMA